MGHIIWPPKLLRTDVLGEVKDGTSPTNNTVGCLLTFHQVCNRKITRDIGRPCHIGGNTYYAFGDTFCHDAHGEFVGVTNNTIALCPDPRGDPTRSEYLEGSVRARAFVPHTKGEVSLALFLGVVTDVGGLGGMGESAGA